MCFLQLVSNYSLALYSYRKNIVKKAAYKMLVKLTTGQNFPVIMSSFCIGAIACDRFRFIMQPHKKQMTAKQVKKKESYIKIIIFHFPLIISFQYERQKNNRKSVTFCLHWLPRAIFYKNISFIKTSVVATRCALLLIWRWRWCAIQK